MKYLTATLKDFEQLISRKKEEIKKEENLVLQLLPELQDIARSATSPVPRILYVSESELKDFFIKQSPIWNQSMLDIGETSWWGYNSYDLVQHKFAREWVDWYWKNSPRKIELHLFSPDNEGEREIVKKNYDRRHIKYLSEEQDSSLWILGDYIIMIVTNQKPQYAIQIKDRLMAESLRRTYRKLWQLIP
jgi:hypothetical protein